MATYRATALATASGEEIRNVFHVVHAGEATVEELAGSLRNAWQTRFLPVLHSSYQFLGVEVTNIADEGQSAFAATTGPSAGANTEPPLPTWACISISLQTPTKGRTGTGRMGLSPVGESCNATPNGNNLAPAFQAAFQTAITSFIADIASSGGAAAMLMAVVSRIDNKVERPQPLVSLVTSGKVSPFLGTRLSRHPRR